MTLASFGTRHTLSETRSNTRGIGAAREHLLAAMKAVEVGSKGGLVAEAQKESVLPLLLEGEKTSALPPLLHGRVHADFRNEAAYFAVAFDLILSLYRLPPNLPAVADLRESPWTGCRTPRARTTTRPEPPS